MNRKQIAERFHISPRMLADAVFVVNNAPQNVVDQIEAGTLTIQAAMRILGKTTQRDRNRRRTAMVTELCAAVLDGEYPNAERLPFSWLVASDSIKRLVSANSLSLRRIQALGLRDVVGVAARKCCHLTTLSKDRRWPCRSELLRAREASMCKVDDFQVKYRDSMQWHGRCRFARPAVRSKAAPQGFEVLICTN